MENASKALLIAGAALLAMLLLSLLVYVFNNIGSGANDIYENLKESDITEFNQKFLNYDGKTNLKIQDVVTIINIAIDNNERGVVPIDVVVRVTDSYGSETVNPNITQDDIINNLNSSYTCFVEYADNIELIETIVIRQN